MQAKCEVCGERPPNYFVHDSQGLEAKVCRKCRPIFTSKAILNELELQREHFEDKLTKYAKFMKQSIKGDKEDSIYKMAYGFEEDFQVMADRMSQVTLKKKFGRRPANNYQQKNYQFKEGKKTWQQSKK